MHDWNVVVSLREGEYERGRRLLKQFGTVGETGFYNVLVLRADDLSAVLGRLQAHFEREPDDRDVVGHVCPCTEGFDFQSPEEFERKAREAAERFLPRLAGKTFHVRMHRRGFKGRMKTPEEERFLDGALLEGLEREGTPGEITFEDPDAIVAVETVGTRAGLALFTRDDLRRYPFLHLD